MTTPRNAFGTLLRDLRKAAGMTQERLAAAAGVEAHVIWQLENGKSQCLPTMARALAPLGYEIKAVKK